MRILRYSLFTLLFFTLWSCQDDDEESVIRDFSVVKSENWRNNIGNEFTVEGFLVETGGIYRLVAHPEDLAVDAVPVESDYLYLEPVQDILTNFANSVGSRVEITGTLAANGNQTIQTSSQILGDVSLATLIINQAGGIRELAPSQLETPFNVELCERYPQFCQLDFGQFNKTALLYSGGINQGLAHIRYWNDLKLMYSILRNNGYPEDNIRVIYKNGIGEDSSIPVHYAARPNELNQAFDYLRSRMNEDSKFFVMLNNHGGGLSDNPRWGNSGTVDEDNDEINTESPEWDEQYFYYNHPDSLTDDILAIEINALPFSSMIGIIKPCFAGGVIWDFRGPNRVIMTAGKETEVTWAHTSLLYGEFTYHFFAAITGMDPITGNAVDADLNGDGQISMYEAQVYIIANDVRNETPQYEDDGDGEGTSTPDPNGFGASMFL